MFSGKILIPGDKIEEFFNLLEKFEKERAPFREYLEGLNEEFAQYLTTKFKARTVNKHTWIITMFIEFLCKYTNVKAIEEVTRGMVNTHFHHWYKRKVWNRYSYNNLRVALKKFFKFLETEKNIKNTKVMRALH